MIKPKDTRDVRFPLPQEDFSRFAVVRAQSGLRTNHAFIMDLLAVYQNHPREWRKAKAVKRKK